MQIKAKKSLGQHFLNSRSTLNKIISATQVKREDIILEIGPGTGVLTSELLKLDVNIIAVEKDTHAYQFLMNKYSEHIQNRKLMVINEDILKTNLKEFGLKNGKYSLIANIPYYITGAILEKFLEYEPRPNHIVLLVQKEVANRIMSQDGKESILSISVKTFGIPKIIGTVPRGAFSPPPKVDSAIIRIDNISNENLTKIGLETRVFFQIVKEGFSHKRKFMLSNLKNTYSPEKLNKIWLTLKIDKRARAESITLDQWFKIAERLSKD